jgi:hypothetical protein
MYPMSAKGRGGRYRLTRELISRREVKHKVRNNSDSRSSVTGNGGGEHWSGDTVDAQLPSLREWKGG